MECGDLDAERRESRDQERLGRFRAAAESGGGEDDALRRRTEDEALKMITLNAAWIVGVDDRVGSIDVGKDADLVIWDGYPLSSFAVPNKVLIDGEFTLTGRCRGLGCRTIRRDNEPVSGSQCLRFSGLGFVRLAAGTVAFSVLLFFAVRHSAFAQHESLSSLKGGKVLTITHGVIENGVVVMEDGKISAVGARRVGESSGGCAGHRCDGDDGLSGADRFGDASWPDGDFRREHDQRPDRD